MENEFRMLKSEDTVIVAGGCGFIGSVFLRYLASQGHQGMVVVFDKLTYAGRIENLINADLLNMVFWKGDICSKSDVEEVIEKTRPRVIFNFAAESHVDRSIDGPMEFVHTNYVGTVNLLMAALPSQIRVIQISTDEVYGDLHPHVPASREADPIRASSPYSATKAAADLMALAYARTYDLDVVITRCSNNYGPRQYPEKLIPVMTLNALENKNLPVYGDGLNVRDWIHVSDHCAGIHRAAQNGISGRVYNFGGNNQITNISLVRAILEHLDKPESLIEYVEDRKGHDRRYAIDFSRAKEELGWEPEIDFLEIGLGATVDWYQSNAWWWKPLLKNSE